VNNKLGATPSANETTLVPIRKSVSVMAFSGSPVSDPFGAPYLDQNPIWPPEFT
jgi:hypothetical protein